MIVSLPFSITLDTPMNRKFMPKADKSTWTPLDFVAKYGKESFTRSIISNNTFASIFQTTLQLVY